VIKPFERCFLMKECWYWSKKICNTSNTVHWPLFIQCYEFLWLNSKVALTLFYTFVFWSM